MLKRCLWVLVWAGLAHGAIGVSVYESKGIDVRRTQTGHLGLIATQICADGIGAVRSCRPGEPPGVVIMRYAGLAWGLPIQVMVTPLRYHWYAADSLDQAPLISNGEILKQAHLKYWREHLQPEIPAMSEAEYQEHRRELKRFRLGRELRSAMQFEFLMKLLARSPDREATEPIALRDPVSGKLVRNGRWREVIGVRHTRDSVVFLMETTPQQELRLVRFLEDERREPFNAFSSNCSDFVARGLRAVIDQPDFRLRPRYVDFANVGVRSPVSVSTSMVRYVKSRGLPYRVWFQPMLPGTRTPTAPVRSIVGGALLPTPVQGNLAFGIRVALLQMNPMILALSQAADFASLPVDPDREVTAYARSAGQWEPEDNEAPEGRTDAELRMRLFGAPECWDQKREAFRNVLDWAVERQILPEAAREPGLKSGKPYAIARVLEREGWIRKLGPAALTMTRARLSESLRTGNPVELEEALPYLLAAIHFDIVNLGVDRRPTLEFDPDWELLSRVLGRLRYVDAGSMGEGVENCSIAAFEAGARLDARTRAQRTDWLQRPLLMLIRGPRK